MSQQLSQSMHSSGVSSPMSNVSNIIINNYSNGGSQPLLSPVKTDLFGDKPSRFKETDKFALMKLIKKSSRKETQKSASTQLDEKADLVETANYTINSANDELEDSRAQLCLLFDAGMGAVAKSKKQSKQAAALMTTIDKQEKKIATLQKKLNAKTQLVEKLRGEADTAKEKKRMSDESFRAQKEIFADAHKAMKESNTLAVNENKEKATTIKRLESDVEKLRRENEKLKANGADGGKRNDNNSLENKMTLETHKRLMELLVKTSKDAATAKNKNDRLKTIVSGGGALPGAFGGISGNFADLLGGVMKNEEQTKEKKRGRSRSSRRRSHRSSSSSEDDSSVSTASSNRKSKRRDRDRKSEKRRRHSRDHKREKRRSRGRSRRRSPSADESSYISDSSTSYHRKRESDRKSAKKNRSREKENKPVNVAPPPSNVTHMSTDASGTNVLTTSRNLFNSFSTPAAFIHKNDATAVTQLTQTHPDPEENGDEPNIGMYLTPDSIKGMLGCGDNANITAHTPTVQVLAIKEISNDSPTAVKRWKLVVSDGEFYMSGMLATQLNDMVASGEIKQNAIIKLKHFMLTTMPESGARIFVLLEAEHQHDMEKRLGDPVDIKKALKGNDDA